MGDRWPALFGRIEDGERVLDDDAYFNLPIQVKCKYVSIDKPRLGGRWQSGNRYEVVIEIVRSTRYEAVRCAYVGNSLKYPIPSMPWQARIGRQIGT